MNEGDTQPSFWSRLSRGIDRMNDFIGGLLLWLVGAMVLVGSFNAIARYLGRYMGVNLSSNAYLELQWYLFSLVFLLGGAYGLRHEAHVRVDVIFGALSERARAWVDVLGTLIFLIPFSGFMLWVSWPSVAASWRIREQSPDPGGLARYPLKAVVLIAFTLLLLQAISELIKRIQVLRGTRTLPSSRVSSPTLDV